MAPCVQCHAGHPPPCPQGRAQLQLSQFFMEQLHSRTLPEGPDPAGAQQATRITSVLPPLNSSPPFHHCVLCNAVRTGSRTAWFVYMHPGLTPANKQCCSASSQWSHSLQCWLRTTHHQVLLGYEHSFPRSASETLDVKMEQKLSIREKKAHILQEGIRCLCKQVLSSFLPNS